MTILIKVTGRDNLIEGANGLTGALKVTISGGKASRSTSITVQILNAANYQAAEYHALLAVDEYAKTLRARVSEELARISNP